MTGDPHSEPLTPDETIRRQKKYAQVLPIIREVARGHGYAIGVHGSEVRDLDLIAAPWTEAAVSADVLAERVCKSVFGVIVNDEKADPQDFTRRNPQPKPHGRLGWSIQVGRGAYIDLSVMPRAAASEASAEEWRAKYEALLGERIDHGWALGWQHVKAAEASVQRLTEALRKIAMLGETPMVGYHNAESIEIARAALDEAQKVKP